MIRPATERDVPEMLSIYGPYITDTTITFEYDVPTEEAFLARFQDITRQFPWLVWEEDGRILGYCYASAPFQRAAYGWCAEPSVYLRPEARGKGLGRKLYAALEAVLKRQGYQVMLAIITQENDSSLRFHSRCGYTVNSVMENCGFKFGRWLSITWMEKRLIPVEIPKDSPIPWPELRQDAQRNCNIVR